MVNIKYKLLFMALKITRCFLPIKSHAIILTVEYFESRYRTVFA